MPIPDSSVVQISVLGQSNGQAVVNVFHYTTFTLNPNFNSTMTDLLTGFRDAWRTAILPGLVDDYKVGEYRGVEIRGTELVPTDPNARRLKLGEMAVLIGAGAADQGGDAGDPLPDYVAITVQKLTGLAGRENRGSCRMGPISKLMVTVPNANALTAAGIAAGANFASFVRGSVGSLLPGDRLNPCIFNRTRILANPAPQVSTVGFRVSIIGAAANPFVGSQVSRKQRSSSGA
jgi:hypothetical protein